MKAYPHSTSPQTVTAKPTETVTTTLKTEKHKKTKRSLSSNSYFIPTSIFIINNIVTKLMKELDPRNNLFTKRSKIHKWIRIKLISTIIICCILAVIYWHRTFSSIMIILEWMGRHPFIGGLAYILIYGVLTVFCVPGSALAIGAGYIYHHNFGLVGLAVASFIVFFGAFLGAVLAFLNSRYLFKEYAIRFARNNMKFRVIQHLIKEKGFQFAFLIRISPTLPFLATNYVLGCSEISLFSYSMALFGIFPGCVLYAGFGTTLSQLSDLNNASQNLSNSKWTLIFLIIGITVGTIGLIIFAVVARRKFVFYMEQYQQLYARGDQLTFSPRSPSFASMSYQQRKQLFEIDDQTIANTISNSTDILVKPQRESQSECL